MNFNDLIDTINEIVNNDKIYKSGLVMVYVLENDNFDKMDEHLYYKLNKGEGEYKKSNIIELEIKDIKIRFVRAGYFN